MKSLRNVKRVELVMIPLLVVCVIPSAFKCVEDVKMENAGLFESVKEMKEAIERRRREEEERKKREEAAVMAKKRAVISCKRDWDCVDKPVGAIEVSNMCCNEEGLTELDLRGFVNLRELKVGNKCFENVKEVKLIGLSELESVEIGMNSFTKFKNTWQITSDPNRRFYVRSCPKLKSLKMGRYSFSDYTVCEIENVDALESIEMGELNEKSANFAYASLELKSILIHRE